MEEPPPSPPTPARFRDSRRGGQTPIGDESCSGRTTDLVTRRVRTPVRKHRTPLVNPSANGGRARN
ncbi:hypothetical protein ACFVIN_03780, partial [Streptomyces prasinus]